MTIYNVKAGDGSPQTLNIININNQLNSLTDLLNGIGSGGSISDTQLQNINKRITDISTSLNDLKNDVDKYIDETELQTELSSINSTVSNKVDNTTFLNNINSITSQLSTINGQLSNLVNTISGINMSNYYNKLETENEIDTRISSKLSQIEETWKKDIADNVIAKVETRLNDFKDDFKSEINNDITTKLNDLKSTINGDMTTKLNDYKTVAEYNQDITNFAKLNQSNNFNENMVLDKDLNVAGNTTIKTIKLNNDIIITYDTELKLGNQSLPLNLLSNGNIKINGSEIDFNNLNGGNVTLPNNLVYNNQSNDFTILPTYNSLNFATEKYVNDEIKKVSNIQLPSNLAKTDTQTDFTIIPTINGINVATIQDISNSISNIPQYQLPSTVVKNDSPNDFKVLPTINGMNFATETFVSNEIDKINFTIPENYVRNNVKTDFTYVPTISGIDIATKTYVNDEVAKIPKITLPETMVKTDIENNFTVIPKINGINMATTLDISNSISQIPQYNLPSNVVKNDTPTDFTVVPQINGKDITTKEYVDNAVAGVTFTLPQSVVHNNTSNNFTIEPTINNNPIATQKYVNDRLSGVKYITLPSDGVFTISDERSYYIDNTYSDTDKTTNKLNKIKGGKEGDIINIRLTKNLEVIHNTNAIKLLDNKSLLKTNKIKMDSNKFLTLVCLTTQSDSSDSIWAEYNRSWGYEPSDYSNVAKLSENNIFTGTNTMTNINLGGQISFSNNPLLLFRYMNLGGTNTSVFHLGNANFPLNLLAKDNKVFLNGTEVSLGGGATLKTVFDGSLNIDFIYSESGSMYYYEYDYSTLVTDTDYKFIYILFYDGVTDFVGNVTKYSNVLVSSAILVPRNGVYIFSDINNSIQGTIRDSEKKIIFTSEFVTHTSAVIKNITLIK